MSLVYVNALRTGGRDIGEGDGFFNGLIDEMVIFNRALLPTEVSFLFSGLRYSIFQAAGDYVIGGDGFSSMTNPEEVFVLGGLCLCCFIYW